MADDMSQLVGELRGLLAKATPSLGLPLRTKANPGEECSECGELMDADELLIARSDGPGVALVLTDDREAAIAALIVAAINALPALLDAASESATIRAENERLANQLDELEQFIDETLPEYETDDGEHQELDRLRSRVASLEAALEEARKS